MTYQFGALSADSGAADAALSDIPDLAGPLEGPRFPASEAIDEAVAIAAFDRAGMLVDANSAFLSAMGCCLDDMLGRTHDHFQRGEKTASLPYASLWRRLGEGQPVEGKFVWLGSDAREVWFLGSYRLVRDAAGAPVRALLIGQDITASHREHEDLRGQLAAVRRSMLFAEFGLDGHLAAANENFLEAFGYRQEEVAGCHHAIFVGPDYAGTSEYAQFWASLREGMTRTVRDRRFGKDGREVWVDAAYYPILDALGMPCKVVSYATDLTLRKRIERAKSAEFAFAADHDGLTGLYNRAALARHLQESSLRPQAQAGTFDVVMMIDLDGFKTINDAYGHQAGDSMLWVVGQRIKDCLRDRDFVARLGGDEFAVLMSLHPRQAGTLGSIARRILDSISEPIAFHNEQLAVSASIGIAVKDGSIIEHGADGDDMLGYADAALHEAKQAGKNTSRTFDWDLKAQLARRQLLERELETAIREGSIVLHYQPIVTLPDGKVAGYEALSRWQHPSLGAISPAEFIPIAEVTGQIHALGHGLLHQAMRFAASLPPALWVAVNISAQQLQRDTLAGTIIDLARQYGVEPERIEIEITETSALSDAPAIMANLRKLKDAGFGLSLDDFGTGYSSLSHLLLLSFNRIKIDRSFVADCLRSVEKACIVDAVLGLGRALGISLIAEGVETQDVADRLGDKGCQYAQGALFGWAAPPEQITDNG